MAVKANRAFEELTSLYREIRHRGPDAQRGLLPLLGDPEPGVSMWAASHALEFAPEQAVPVLQALDVPMSWIGLEAHMTLQQWREGNLAFP